MKKVSTAGSSPKKSELLFCTVNELWGISGVRVVKRGNYSVHLSPWLGGCEITSNRKGPDDGFRI